MNKRILRFSNEKDKEILTAPCRDFNPQADMQIVEDLYDTFEAHKKEALGLSANQIGYAVRAFITRDPTSGQLVVLTNPSVTMKSKETYLGQEGCLSNDDPSKLFYVQRHRAISVWATAYTKYNDGGLIKYRSGVKAYTNINKLPAQVFQHELDHLAGKVI